jgi:hypothetical protein
MEFDVFNLFSPDYPSISEFLDTKTDLELVCAVVGIYTVSNIEVKPLVRPGLRPEFVTYIRMNRPNFAELYESLQRNVTLRGPRRNHRHPKDT